MNEKSQKIQHRCSNGFKPRLEQIITLPEQTFFNEYLFKH